MSLPDGLAGAVERPDVFVVLTGEPAIEAALVSAARLRSAGKSVVLDPFPERSLKAQMRRAHDLQARHVLILGIDEVSHGTVTVKRMADGTQRTVPEARILDALSEVTHG
jgi:histidyl-tRNA synthetase